MNTITLILSINTDTRKTLETYIKDTYQAYNEPDNNFSYVTADALINAATEVAVHENGYVLRWDYLRADWTDITVLETAINDLDDKINPWQYVKKDDYDTEVYESINAYKLHFYLVLNEDVEITSNDSPKKQAQEKTIYLKDILTLLANATEVCISDNNKNTTVYEGKAYKCPSNLFDMPVTGLYLTNILNIQID